MRRLALPAVLAGIAVAAAVLAVWPEATPSAAASSAGHATPVLSPRRVPTFLVETLADSRLRAGVQAALADRALAPALPSSCVAVDVGRRSMVRVRADQAVLPASNAKLLTAVTALEVLGVDTTLRTDVRGRLGAGGVVAGDVWLVGGGDPLLATGDYVASFKHQPQPSTPLEELARRVRAAGVTQITGRVVGDESRYDTQRYVPSWKPGYIADNEIGPMTALTVNDGFSAFRPRKVPAMAPATSAAEIFTAALRNNGVTVVGVPAQGKAPAGQPVLSSIDSLPIKDVVGEMLRESDNGTAELLLKEVGHKASGAGTTAAGLAAVRSTLLAKGLPLGHLVMTDGSGLDRGDRVTCALLLGLVEQVGTAGPVAAGLPVAHTSGTLDDDFADSPAAGRLRGKTGSLNGVSALSGVVPGRRPTDPDVTFSVVLNGLPRDSLGPRTWVRIGGVLAAYPEAPDPTTLGPR